MKKSYLNSATSRDATAPDGGTYVKTPDITPAQVVAIVQAVIAVCVAFAVPISGAQSAALLGLTTIVASVLLGADAAIRRGRAKVVEAQVLANGKEPESKDQTGESDT
jgi:hypothetical protein